MQRFHRPQRATIRLLLLVFGFSLTVSFVLVDSFAGWAAVQAQTATPATSPAVDTDDSSDDSSVDGYDYTVKVGDSWSSLAARTGFTIAQLQAANPQSLRSTEYLLVGEVLRIPASQQEPITTPGATETYEVGAGESWNSIAQKFGVPARLLRDANPQAIRNGLVLYRGERLVIPAQPAAPGDSATPASASVVTVTVTPEPPTPSAPAVTATVTPIVVELSLIHI